MGHSAQPFHPDIPKTDDSIFHIQSQASTLYMYATEKVKKGQNIKVAQTDVQITEK